MESPRVLEPFQPSEPHTWEDYVERFEFFAVAQGITDASKRRATFLSYCGPETFKLAKALLAPAKLSETSLKDILACLTSHLAPTETKMARRMEFHKRQQHAGESVSAFLAELRKLAQHCGFQNLEETLLDRFIGGLSSKKARRRIVAKEEVTLASALKEATATENYEREELDASRKATKPQIEVAHAMDELEATPSQSPVRGVELVRQACTVHKDRRGSCPGCGGNHERKSCRFRDAMCRTCGKTGHIARVCRSAASGATGAPRLEHRRPPTAPRFLKDCHYVTEINGRAVQFPAQGKAHVKVKIEGQQCDMEVDSGSAFTIVSDQTAKTFFPRGKLPPLEPFPATLQSYSAGRIHVMGMCAVRVQFRDKQAVLKLVIAKGSRPSLLGTDWFPALGLSISGLNSIQTCPEMSEALCKEFAGLFNGKLGCYKGPPVDFELDPGVAPIRLKPRRVPFALQPKIEAELDKLVKQGVLSPVDSAKWETPIVTPLKANGEVRICADYKCTINKALRGNSYPIPVVSHLLAKLAGGKVFAKIDLAQAYQQLPVTPQSAEAQTIVTHKGAFRVNRLQFGVCVAPGIFQGLMERLLRGLPGVLPFFDDVLIAGKDPQELVARVRAVLLKFKEVGLQLKKEKCSFGVPTVDFLGFKIDASGIHPTDAKIKAIIEAPRPQNKTELQSFLGLINFYHSFLPQKASVAEPLHRLLHKKTVWRWGREQQKAFDSLREMLSSRSVLAHYDESKPLVLACDASQYGLGAVLSHREPDGSEKPISFYSRTLSPTERNYAQIDKEALAIVSGIKKFYDYLYGRHFSIETDHKPLLGLFNPNKQTPQILSPRMLRWSIFLNGFQYTLTHVPGKQLCHADALSRLPLPGGSNEDPAPAEHIMMLETLPGAPVTATDIAEKTRKDAVLSRVLTWVGRGWPGGPHEEKFRPYATRQHELSMHKGCLLWGDRVIIPAPLRNRVLETLHMGHPGMVRMKSLARCYVWWPGMDQNIEQWVRTCKACQEVRPEVARAPVHWWEQSRAPWSRLHIDFAGPFQGKVFLVIVDAYSKWLEVAMVPSMASAAVIKVLRQLFATHGLPETIVSDNGAAFVSQEFRAFLADNFIRGVTSAPFHPSSNGQAERMVRTAKESIARLMEGNWSARIARMLFLQHATPCTATGKSPAELLLGRRLVTVLDYVHPDKMPNRNSRATPQAETDTTRYLAPEDLVWVRNYSRGPRWVAGVITRASGPVSYYVTLENGQVWKRHIDQLRRRALSREESDNSSLANDAQLQDQSEDGPEVQSPGASANEPGSANPQDDEVQVGDPEMSGTPSVPDETPIAAPPPQVTPNPEPATPVVRRSGRSCRTPQYLRDYVCCAH
ncbi:uncharacterized protein K02A2.6-like [Zootoca vivipara]|uniref:uncharacterized protein K02A2.6-like n=1 Tax=Zootoca vivipara TaxID=8524 RepID=UPI00293B944A|nr:uncharacterized protein K02A2.6-like [Zootoca vivipara]